MKNSWRAWDSPDLSAWAYLDNDTSRLLHGRKVVEILNAASRPGKKRLPIQRKRAMFPLLQAPLRGLSMSCKDVAKAVAASGCKLFQHHTWRGVLQVIMATMQSLFDDNSASAKTGPPHAC